MFEHALIDDKARRVGPGALAVSILVQVLLLSAGSVASLLYTPELPVGRLLARSRLLMSPPVPLAAVEAAPSVAPPTPVERFQPLLQPRSIPDRIVMVGDARLAPGISMPVGLAGFGEAAAGYSSGVFGARSLASLPEVLPPRRIRRGGRVQEALLIQRVPPVYPREAVEQAIAGLVVLEAIIGIDGSIHEIKVVSGDPLLAASTVAAVKQWRYRPTELNGTAVEVITRIEVTFKLQPHEPADFDRKKKKGRSRP